MHKISHNINYIYVISSLQMLSAMTIMFIIMNNPAMFLMIPLFLLSVVLAFRHDFVCFWIICFSEPELIQDEILKFTKYKGSKTLMYMRDHLNGMIPEYAVYIWMCRLHVCIEAARKVNNEKEEEKYADDADTAWLLMEEKYRMKFSKWVYQNYPNQ